MIRRVTLASLALTLTLGAAPARAQVFGQYTGAETLPVNGRLFGAYLHTSDHVLGATGQLRLSFFPGVDFGFQAGLSRLNLDSGDRTTIRLGTDVRTAVVRPSDTSPFTIAAGGALGVENSDQYSVVTIGPEAVASRAYSLGGTNALTPYLGALIALSHTSNHGNSESEMTLPLRLGAELAVSTTARVLVELQLLEGKASPDHFQIVAGANFPF